MSCRLSAEDCPANSSDWTVNRAFRKDPRDFGYRLPRKALQLAPRMAIASRVHDNEITVIDDLRFDAPKTSEMAGVLKALKCDGKTLLVATAGSVVGIGLAVGMIWAFTRFVRGADGRPLFDISLQPDMALQIAAIAIVCGVLAAIVPARRAARMDPAQAIRL